MNHTVITYEKLTGQNFHENSLDTFICDQEVTLCWRKVEGEWNLLPITFTEAWNLQECRSVARNIVETLGKTIEGYAAFADGRVVGYVTVGTRFFGSRSQYLQLAEFEVSQPYRGQHIGKGLFALACEEARSRGAEKLYISAHSSKESQAAYKALGCVHAGEINAKLAELEPCDVQMEYVL